MKLARPYLVLLNPIYWVITYLRNLFYDLGLLKSKLFNLPIIAIGNLSTGGTGKTPHTEFVVSILKENHQIAVLSRGYRRSSTGFQIADENSTSKMVGDEPAQMKKRFQEVTVAVDADRVNGVNQLLALDNKPDVIVLDDAYQHRKLQAGFYVLLTTYQQLYTDDWILPAGNLREPASGADRSSIIVVTKCPNDVGKVEMAQIIKRLKPKPQQEVFFSKIKYDKPISAGSEFDFSKPFVLLTGIANPDSLKEYLVKKGSEFEHLNFPDHHHFTNKEIEQVILGAEQKGAKQVLTTEKDFQRLDENQFATAGLTLSYIPIAIDFLKGEKAFSSKILSFVNDYNL